jgi:hypothetical protein
MAIVCFLLLAASVACGRKEADAPRPAAATETAKASEVPSPGPARESAQGPPAGTFSAIVVPPNPSRLIPPRVEVSSTSGEIPVVLEVRWKVGGVIVSEGERLSPALFRKGETIAATVIVRAGEGTVTVETPRVTAASSLPSVTDVRLEPAGMRKGDTVKAIVKAESPDGEPLRFRYQWFIDDAQVPGDAPELSLREANKGSWVHVMVVPNDPLSGGGWRYSPKYKVLNPPPAVRAAGEPNLSPEGVLTSAISATDSDGVPLSMELVSGPPGMTLSGTALRWAVPEGAYGKEAPVTLRIYFGDGDFMTHTLALTPRKK